MCPLTLANYTVASLLSAPFVCWSLLTDRPMAAPTGDDSRAVRTAARMGDLSALSALQASGVNILAADGFGDTSLHHAGGSGHVDIVKWLLSPSIDTSGRLVSTVNNSGYTPLHAAVSV